MKTGSNLIIARFFERPWQINSDEQTDKILEKLTLGLQKLAQNLDLDLLDEEDDPI